MKITKEQVLTAIKTEPLKAGSFLRADGKPINECEVCAVGAVMRNVLNNKIEDEDDFHKLCGRVTREQFIDNDVDVLLKNENYLGALSNYFEEMIDCKTWVPGDINLIATQDDIKELVTFVEENFPEEFEVNV